MYLKGKYRKSVYFLLVVSLALCTCAHPDEQFKNILAAPDKFHKQEVQVVGVLHWQAKDAAIYLTTNNNTAEAFWIRYNHKVVMTQTIETLDRRHVRITGIFDKNDKGYSSQYAGTIAVKEVILK